jgi:hypothetical protein
LSGPTDNDGSNETELLPRAHFSKKKKNLCAWFTYCQFASKKKFTVSSGLQVELLLGDSRRALHLLASRLGPLQFHYTLQGHMRCILPSEKNDPV